MKVLVMQQGLYLGRHGAWVQSKELAARFRTSSEALDYCVSKGLRNVDFLLRFEDSHWDIRLPGILESKTLPMPARGYFPGRSTGASH
jgi:hypothetical protein